MLKRVSRVRPLSNSVFILSFLMKLDSIPHRPSSSTNNRFTYLLLPTSWPPSCPFAIPSSTSTALNDRSEGKRKQPHTSRKFVRYLGQVGQLSERTHSLDFIHWTSLRSPAQLFKPSFHSQSSLPFFLPPPTLHSFDSSTLTLQPLPSPLICFSQDRQTIPSRYLITE